MKGLLRIKCVFKHQYLQMFGIKLTNMNDFQLLEVVSCGSETQLQVGENLNKIISREQKFNTHYAIITCTSFQVSFHN